VRNILLIAAIITICSCSKKAEEVPAGIVSKPQMVDILIDIHIVEAKINQLRINKDSANKVFTIFEKDIFEKHKVQDSVYRKSYGYYLDHPKVMEEIYNAVVDSLSYREQLHKTD